MKIPIDAIRPNPQQPRDAIQESSLLELAESIRQHGVINPIAVEQAGDGGYTLIDGERRWRAAKIAGLTEIEASVRPGLNGAGDMERLILATTANIQRADMNPVERARVFRDLAEKGMNGSEIARALGISAGVVSWSAQLLELAPRTVDAFSRGVFPTDHRVIRALHSLDVSTQDAIVNACIRRPMTAQSILALIGRIGHAYVRKLKKYQSCLDLRDAYTGDHWNMIAQAGSPHLPNGLRRMAEETCQACVLYDDACNAICRECPAVVLLLKISEENSHG